MSLNNPHPETEIQTLEEQLLDAMRSLDLSFLESVFSEKYVFMDSDGAIWGKFKAEKALDLNCLVIKQKGGR
jgi:hypothetical protein